MTITLSSILAFSLAIFMLAVTPGPAFFALTARSISSGTMAGIGVILGILTADLIYFSLAIIGMVTVLETIASSFVYIKLAGGAYLIWLGIVIWRKKPTDNIISSDTCLRGFMKNYLEGLAVNITNPKAILFFAALLPNFISLSTISVVDYIILLNIIILIGGITDLTYVILATRIRKRMKNKRAQNFINRASGVTLIIVGIGISTR